MGSQMKVLPGLKSRTTWDGPPFGPTRNWYTGVLSSPLAVAVQTTGDSIRGTGGLLPDKETDGRQRSSRGVQCGRCDRSRRAAMCLALIRLSEGVTNCHIG